MKRGYWKVYLKIIFIIIVIALIITGAIYFINEAYQKEKIETIKTDMLSIQGEVQSISTKVTMKEKEAHYIGKDVKELKNDELINNLKEKGIINLQEKDVKYYLLDNENLKEMGLENINVQEGYYIIEYNSGEVIYTNGIEDENKNVVYKLSEIVK